MLTREQILALDDRPRQAVEVPEWDTTVYVRKFSGRDRFALETLYTKPNITEIELVVTVVSVATVDDNGARLFTVDDVEALQDKSLTALHRIYKAALQFNAMTDEAEKEAGNA